MRGSHVVDAAEAAALCDDLAKLLVRLRESLVRSRADRRSLFGKRDRLEDLSQDIRIEGELCIHEIDIRPENGSRSGIEGR